MLQVENLSFGFTNQPLIECFDFVAYPGEIWMISGPNGAGKSTLMSLVAGFRQPNFGSIHWRANAQAKPQEVKDFCEYLPAEANGHLLKLDAESNLRFWHQLRTGNRVTAPALDAVLHRWRLDHPLVRRGLSVEKFSTGMKRRLAMARLELNAAQLWLLDEPLFGLDRAGIQSFIEMLTRHQNRAGTALIVSHDLASLNPLGAKGLDSATFRRPAAR